MLTFAMYIDFFLLKGKKKVGVEFLRAVPLSNKRL